MFTGIINNLGKVLEIKDSKLRVQTEKEFMSKLDKGLSISVDGICLTVAKITAGSFTVDFMPETEAKTNLKYLKAHDLVNLELPVTPTTLLSGHIVQGHIDGLALLENSTKDNNSYILKFSASPLLTKYIVEKGSIAINGISLTVIEVGSNYFTVGIIPHTWENTGLQNIKLRDFVNIEVDILAKYLERLTKND